MVLGFIGRLDQFIDHVSGGGLVGITHAKINNILAGPAGLHLHLVEGGEQVGRQSFDAGKFHAGSTHLCVKPLELGDRSTPCGSDLYGYS